ncbi:MAG: amidohydrolase family protein [Sphingomonadales bacterium]|jgi:predicted amidohydrolase YtcJ|nr:amidohydrolase family protein [Sphingomonadales bacterium]MBK9002806.1 amidohydrolase family protein [Sphingomonadales bacterium]MBK9268031.1 amidohydrolase family protein [Sphingomonadales bacterium]MBP6433317.1 amidohydrolase family protein [Sphingorhabdus sp.]
MQLNRRTMLAALGATPLLTAATVSNSPVTVYRARRIVTMDPHMPVATHVAVADGTILGTANSISALEPLAGGREVRVDNRFENAVLMPGFIDPHVHPMQSAVMLNLPFVAPEDWALPSHTYKGAHTPAAYRKRLKEELARSKTDPFICWGHHELFHGPLDRKALSKIAPDRAVIIWQRSFHEVILNDAAMRLWGVSDRAAFDALIKAGHADPHHADFDKGIFAETALMAAVGKMRPHLVTPQLIQRGMGEMQRMMLASGVTTVSDMGTGVFASFEIEAGLIKAAFERGDNPSRVMLMPMASTVAADTDLDRWFAGIEQTWRSPHIRVDRRVKMLADGAFFAQNMMMNPPGYSNGHEGKWITPPDVVQAQFKRFWEAGFSLHIHVNGDRGLDVVLAGLAPLSKRNGQTITLEHLGYSTEAQNARIAQMGLMVSAQPNYIRVLGDAYAKHGLGTERAAHMNRLGSLERLGVPLGLHSDFNMAPIDPLYLAWIAANRVTIGGKAKAPAERISLDKALRAITIDAARVIGMDGLIGSISVGKKADFTVLAEDPYQLGRKHMREAKILGVMFEGQHRAV